MNLVQKAALNVLNNAYHLKKGETFVIICDKKNKFFSDALEEAALKLGAKPITFILEAFGKRPVKMPKMVLETVRNADAGTWCATDVFGELGTFRRPLTRGLRGYKVRFATMPGINRAAVEQGLNCDFKKLAAFTQKVFHHVKDSKVVHVVTAQGTDITFKVGKYRWACCDGILKPDIKDDNYPDGEVMTAPYDANGKVVVDGVLGEIYDAKYGIIKRTPLTIYVKNCRALKKGFHCKNKMLERDIFEYLFTGHKHSSRVGEVAIGTNLQLKKLIGNLLQDEKFPSFHLAFGDCYYYDTGCPFECDKHIDMILQKPDIYIDGKLLMKKGKFLI